MERLCGRPGCSEFASVAYGMRAEDLVFWLDVLADGAEADHGVLCRRHADTMVVPRGWTLDDLRDSDLHLFRPPTAATRTRPGRARRPAPDGNAVEQLRLEQVQGEQFDDAADVGASGSKPNALLTDSSGTVASEATVEGGPWTPSFDEADDLDGLLSAQSPLLSRAFRTAERPDE